MSFDSQDSSDSNFEGTESAKELQKNAKLVEPKTATDVVQEKIEDDIDHQTLKQMI